jgi:PAS domain-containing protein
MHFHLTFSQVTLLVGTALAVAVALIGLLYFLHRAGRERRAGLDFRAKPPRSENESAFVAATVQGVISDLKSSQREMEARLRAAEGLLRVSQRTLEVLAREIREGLVIINRDGHVARANAAARELLAADLWSRRPYLEILGRDSPLGRLIQDCMESARPSKQEFALGALGRAEGTIVEASIIAIEDSGGGVEGVVCLLRKVSTKPGSALPPEGNASTASANESGS